MKKLILLTFAPALLMIASASYAGMSYECSRYVDGKPTGGYVKVVADSKSEATQKALAKYEKMGYRVDYVNCK